MTPGPDRAASFALARAIVLDTKAANPGAPEAALLRSSMAAIAAHPQFIDLFATLAELGVADILTADSVTWARA